MVNIGYFGLRIPRGSLRALLLECFEAEPVLGVDARVVIQGVEEDQAVGQ